jgi:hypothetical protein
MENLQIRITVTNGKGWRETETISMNQYYSEKEKGNDLFEKTLDKIVSDGHKIVENRKAIDKKFLQWRP